MKIELKVSDKEHEMEQFLTTTLEVYKKCAHCGHVKEIIFPSNDAMQKALVAVIKVLSNE